jgi:transcriptional regulator of acetoin/glycerol metabolism
MIARGEFREDLYYRLNGLVVRLPALRERTDFALVLKKVLHALCENGQHVDISPDAMDLLSRYHWPGNLRQLHNLLRTAVVMVGDEGVIETRHLPDDFLEELRTAGREAPACSALPAPLEASAVPLPAASEAAPDGQRLQDVALHAMAQMLRQHKGNVSAAAKALGVSRNTIYRKKGLLPPGLLD